MPTLTQSLPHNNLTNSNYYCCYYAFVEMVLGLVDCRSQGHSNPVAGAEALKNVCCAAIRPQDVSHGRTEEKLSSSCLHGGNTWQNTQHRCSPNSIICCVSMVYIIYVIRLSSYYSEFCLTSWLSLFELETSPAKKLPGCDYPPISLNGIFSHTLYLELIK